MTSPRTCSSTHRRRDHGSRPNRRLPRILGRAVPAEPEPPASAEPASEHHDEPPTRHREPQPTHEFDVPSSFHEEDAEADGNAEKGEADEDDLLEETPEFLQDTPEHDRLWFEQNPPRDFDFDG